MTLLCVSSPGYGDLVWTCCPSSLSSCQMSSQVRFSGYDFNYGQGSMRRPSLIKEDRFSFIDVTMGTIVLLSEDMTKTSLEPPDGRTQADSIGLSLLAGSWLDMEGLSSCRDSFVLVLCSARVYSTCLQRLCLMEQGPFLRSPQGTLSLSLH